MTSHLEFEARYGAWIVSGSWNSVQSKLSDGMHQSDTYCQCKLVKAKAYDAEVLTLCL